MESAKLVKIVSQVSQAKSIIKVSSFQTNSDIDSSDTEEKYNQNTNNEMMVIGRDSLKLPRPIKN